MRSLIFAIALLLPFQAEAMTGEQWREACESAEKTQCQIYLAGIAHTLVFLGYICPKSPTSPAEMTRDAVLFIKSMNGADEAEASSMIIGRLMQNHACMPK